MPRRPSPNPPGPGDQIRISFLLDRRREPELAYIFDMEGHGDRPREILRLAQLGHQAEVEQREFVAAARRQSLASLGAMPPIGLLPTTTAVHGAVAHQEPVANHASEPTEPVAKAKPAREPVAPTPSQDNRTPEPAATAAQSAATTVAPTSSDSFDSAPANKPNTDFLA